MDDPRGIRITVLMLNHSGGHIYFSSRMIQLGVSATFDPPDKYECKTRVNARKSGLDTVSVFELGKMSM